MKSAITYKNTLVSICSYIIGQLKQNQIDSNVLGKIKNYLFGKIKGLYNDPKNLDELFHQNNTLEISLSKIDKNINRMDKYKKDLV